MVNNEKNILLVGCTGAGKTTLVDALFNYLAGVCIDEDFRLQITNECRKADYTKSQTGTTTCYNLPKCEYLSNKCSLNIIDTPGFNDTDDKDFQIKIVKQVKALLTSRITKLHAICMVSPTCLFRFKKTPHLFEGIFEVFAHDVNDIIYCLCTFDDGGKEHVSKAFDEANIRLKGIYKFCNSYFLDKIFIDNKDDAYNFRSFLDHIYESNGKSVKLTIDFLTGVETLEIQLKGLQFNIGKWAHNIMDIRRKFKILKENREKLNRGDKFEYYEEVSTHFYNRRTINQSCLNCMICERTCHKNCRAEFLMFYWIRMVFRFGVCNSCGCDLYNHINEFVTYEPEFEMVLKIDEDLKKRYADAEEEKMKLKDELRELDFIINRIRNIIPELKEKALRHKVSTIKDYINKLSKEELRYMKPGYEDRANIYAMLQENIECQEPALELLE